MPHRLQWLVDDFTNRVAGVSAAAVVSGDGICRASGGLPKDEADHMAAVASGLYSMSRGAATRFDGDEPGVRQTTVEMSTGFFFVTLLADGSCLAVLASRSCDVGVVSYEMAMFTRSVGEHLATPPRAAG